jgi:hypothetical protein
MRKLRSLAPCTYQQSIRNKIGCNDDGIVGIDVKIIISLASKP